MTDANDLMKPIHDRMLVILEPEYFSWWMETDTKQAVELLPMLRAAPSEGLEAYPVSKSVNSPKNEGRG